MKTKFSVALKFIFFKAYIYFNLYINYYFTGLITVAVSKSHVSMFAWFLDKPYMVNLYVSASFLILIITSLLFHQNQRFDDAFESTRTSASKPSANLRQTNSKKQDTKSLTNTDNKKYLSDLIVDNRSNQKTDEITRRFFENYDNYWPNDKGEATPWEQTQFSKRSGVIHDGNILFDSCVICSSSCPSRTNLDIPGQISSLKSAILFCFLCLTFFWRNTA